jgi:hypothetical protein
LATAIDYFYSYETELEAQISIFSCHEQDLQYPTADREHRQSHPFHF